MLSLLPRHSDWDHSCSFTQSYQPSPKWRSGRPVQPPFRGLLGVHSRYGLHTRAATYMRHASPEASTASLPPQLLRLLPAGTVAGWDLHPLRKRRLTTAHAMSGNFIAVGPVAAMQSPDSSSMMSAAYLIEFLPGGNNRWAFLISQKSHMCWTYSFDVCQNE